MECGGLTPLCCCEARLAKSVGAPVRQAAPAGRAASSRSTPRQKSSGTLRWSWRKQMCGAMMLPTAASLCRSCGQSGQSGTASQASRGQGCVNPTLSGIKPQHSKSTMLTKLMECFSRFLIDHDHKVMEFHRLDQLVKGNRRILAILSVEQDTQIVITARSAGRCAIALGELGLDLVGSEQDAQGHGG